VYELLRSKCLLQYRAFMPAVSQVAGFATAQRVAASRLYPARRGMEVISSISEFNWESFPALHQGR